MACRQLGLNTDQASTQVFAYGFGTGFIWLDSIQCRGVEDRLIDCVHDGFGEHDCFFFEEVGIICPPSASKLSTY